MDTDWKRRNLLLKHLFNTYYCTAEEIYDNLVKYRLDCIKSNIKDDEDISYFFANYEIKRIKDCISSTYQTKYFIEWFNKIFPKFQINYNKSVKISNKIKWIFNISYFIFFILIFYLIVL